MKKESNDLKQERQEVFDLERLKRFMNKKNWTEAQLAAELDLDYSFVYRILRGDRGVGKKFYENLFKLCVREEIPLSYFMHCDLER